MQNFFRKIRHKAIVGEIMIPESASVLDTSCGDGGFLKVLLDKNKDKNLNIFGVDIDVKEVEKAKVFLPQGTFMTSDNKAIPFPDKTFDVVISSMTLHHMANPADSLKEMKRVLKDGSSIYLVDLIAKSKIFYSLLKHIRCSEPYHFEKFYFLPDVEKMLSENGLKIEKVEQVLIFPATSIVMPVLVLKISMA